MFCNRSRGGVYEDGWTQGRPAWRRRSESAARWSAVSRGTSGPTLPLDLDLRFPAARAGRDQNAALCRGRWMRCASATDLPSRGLLTKSRRGSETPVTAPPDTSEHRTPCFPAHHGRFTARCVLSCNLWGPAQRSVSEGARPLRGALSRAVGTRVFFFSRLSIPGWPVRLSSENVRGRLAPERATNHEVPAVDLREREAL